MYTNIIYLILHEEKVKAYLYTIRQADICGRVLRSFCNVDGDDLRQTWKYAFGTNQSPELISKWDKLSCQDRLDQIRDQLSAEEVSILQAQLMQMGGNTLDKIGLLGVLRWWVLGSHTPTGLNDIALHTRLRSGNSELHRRIFEHALSTDNLSYGFSAPVQRIEDAGDIVTVTTRDGKAWKARSVICTVPLNVLASVEFSPRLPADKVAALQQQSVNRCNKVHVDINGPEYLSWGSMATPGKGLISAFGDHLTPVKDTHLVCFGPDPECSAGMTLDNLDTVKDAVVHLLPENKQGEAVINRIVSEYSLPKLIKLFSLLHSFNGLNNILTLLPRCLMIGTRTSSQMVHGLSLHRTPRRNISLSYKDHMATSSSPARTGRMAGVVGLMAPSRAVCRRLVKSYWSNGKLRL